MGGGDGGDGDGCVFVPVEAAGVGGAAEEVAVERAEVVLAGSKEATIEDSQLPLRVLRCGGELCCWGELCCCWICCM